MALQCPSVKTSNVLSGKVVLFVPSQLLLRVARLKHFAHGAVGTVLLFLTALVREPVYMNLLPFPSFGDSMRIAVFHRCICC